MQEILEQFYKLNKDEKQYLLTVMLEGFSITEIVSMKETQIDKKLADNNRLISGMAMRSSSMFCSDFKKVKHLLPLVAKDLLETNVFKGTEFEKELQTFNQPKT